MAISSKKLANSLSKLKVLQDNGVSAIKASELTQVDKERLQRNGFIKEVVKGWYIISSPQELQGDSSSWYSSFWAFCSRYLDNRYGSNYCISAEQSLMLQSGNNTVPKQLIIRSPKGNNLSTQLLYNTSIFVLKSNLPPASELEEKMGIRMHNLPSSIIRSSASVFVDHPIDARAALSMFSDASELLSILLNGGHSRIAGRVAGAYRNIGLDKIANDIVKTMKSLHYDVRELDPFVEASPITQKSYKHSPYLTRIELMWKQMRSIVIDVFPKAPEGVLDFDKYLEKIDEIYKTDAYHSLSIERYKVTAELIERVKSGDWNTEENQEDYNQKNAMVARGYWQAFNAVKTSIIRILKGDNAGNVVYEDHGDWYRELFAPSVAVGLLKDSDLAGYRVNQVYIGRSKHTPINKDALREVMPFIFKLMEQEENVAVRAVLGHFIFVYIHPYMDGNGRIGRFLMNCMLASGGYPWTVIPTELRDEYMDALEEASVNNKIRPFAEFIANLVRASLKNQPLARKI